jgi:hypothetical protein
LNGITGHDFSVIGKRDKPKENHAKKVWSTFMQGRGRCGESDGCASHPSQR